MDDQELSGSRDEFLSLRREMQGENPDPPPADDAAPSHEDAAPADATEPAAAEGDDLSPEERVAAVFGLDDEPADVPEPGMEADEDDEPPEDEPEEYATERERQLAEEVLALREQLAEPNVNAEQQALVAEISALDTQVVQRVQSRYQREVVATSEAHYGAELRKRLAALNQEAERQDDPQGYFNANMGAIYAQVSRAQRDWEAKQAAEWERVVEAEIAAARKQNPKLRQRYAEHLVEEHNLPKRAVEELLKVQNTDDMPVVAESLKASVAAYRKEKNKSKQDLREEAAKRVSREVVTSPSTGKPKAAKPVALKGDEHEWLAMRRLMQR